MEECVMFWNQSLATGVAAIDEQHKSIIDEMNKIFEAGKSGKGPEEVMSTIRFLKDYVQKHFFQEEQLQLKSRYPKYNQHKQAHVEFINIVNKLFERFNNEGATLAVMMDVNKTIADLFIKHINNVDKEFATYYREKNK